MACRAPPTPIPNPRGGREAPGGERRVKGFRAADCLQATLRQHRGHRVEAFGFAWHIDHEGARGVCEGRCDGIEVKVILTLHHRGEGDDRAVACEHGAEVIGGSH